MAKYDAESNATTRVTAAAQLFNALAQAAPAAELFLAGTQENWRERLRRSTRVALYRLDRQLQDFLKDGEVASDADAIDKAARELNKQREREALALMPPERRAKVEAQMAKGSGSA